MSKHTGQDSIKGILLADLGEKSIFVKREKNGVPEYFDVTDMIMAYVGKEMTLTLKEEKGLQPIDMDEVDEELMQELEAKAHYWESTRRAREVALLDSPENTEE